MITTDLNRAEFNGNNTGKVFVFASDGTNIPVRDETHIKVYVGAVLQTLTTHYTVSFVGTTATITFGTAPATGTNNILFVREVPFKQETDLVNNSLLEAESLERQLDLIVNQTQQLNEKLGRPFKLSSTLVASDATETHTTLNLSASARANKGIRFDASGNIAVTTLDIDSISAQVTAAEDAKDDAVTAKGEAVTAQEAAEAVFDNFDDRYLGSKSGSDPTVDNDGDALVNGAIYYNTDDDLIKVYDSSLTPKWRQITTTVANQTNIDALVLGKDGTSSTSGTNTNIAQVNTVALNVANVNNFADLYQINDFTTIPTKDGGGVDNLVSGDLAYDTTAKALRVFNGTSWSSGVNTTEGVVVKNEYTANGSLTHFALSHDQGLEIVYLNGVKLLSGDGSNNNDYFSVSGGSTTTYVGDGNAATHIYFHSAPANTHLISTFAWGASSNTLAVPISGGAFAGAVTLPSPVINTGVSGSAILDSDTMSGASATTLSSSESIKAYVDANESSATITPVDGEIFLINSHNQKAIQSYDGAISFYDAEATGGILRAIVTNVAHVSGNTTNVDMTTVTGSGSGAVCRINNSPFFADFRASTSASSSVGSGYKVGDTFRFPSSGDARITGIVTAVTGGNLLEINPNNTTLTSNVAKSVYIANQLQSAKIGIGTDVLETGDQLNIFGDSTLASTTPGFALTDNKLNSESRNWGFYNSNGKLKINSSTHYNLGGYSVDAIGGNTALTIDNTLNVGIGTTSPNDNAILDLTSTTKAFLPPRMTTTQMNAISSPTAGMMIYNTTSSTMWFYNDAWNELDVA